VTSSRTVTPVRFARAPKDAPIPRQAERLGPEELEAFANHVGYLVGLQRFFKVPAVIRGANARQTDCYMFRASPLCSHFSRARFVCNAGMAATPAS